MGLFSGILSVNLGRTGMLSLGKIEGIENRVGSSKPLGGLWACHRDSKFGWEQWCKLEQPNWLSKENALVSVKNARVLVLDSKEAVERFKRIYGKEILPGMSSLMSFDYKRVAKDFDIVDFRYSDYPMNLALDGIDCDSVLILNKEVIADIKNPQKITMLEQDKDKNPERTWWNTAIRDCVKKDNIQTNPEVFIFLLQDRFYSNEDLAIMTNDKDGCKKDLRRSIKELDEIMNSIMNVTAVLEKNNGKIPDAVIDKIVETQPKMAVFIINKSQEIQSELKNKPIDKEIIAEHIKEDIPVIKNTLEEKQIDSQFDKESRFIDSANKALIDYKMTKYPELQEEYTKTRMLEKMITRDICAFAEKNDSKMIGLEYSAKTASSVEDKLERLQKQRGLAPEKGFEKLYDLVRYTQICDHDKIFPTAKDMIQNLEKEGYTLMAVNNYYQNPYKTTGYKGLHMNFISPYGQAIELQVHSEESFKAKQEGHELYEKIRAVSTPISEKERLTPELVKIHERVPDPPEYDTLQNYQLENEKKEELLKERGNIDFSVKDTTEADICTLMYTLTFPDNDKVYGFEVHQTDGSVVSGIQEEEQEAYVNTYTKEGEQTSSEVDDFFDISKLRGVETLITAGKFNEMISQTWFSENKPPTVQNIDPFTKTQVSLINSIEDGNTYVEKLERLFDKSEAAKAIMLSSGLSPNEIADVIKHGPINPTLQTVKQVAVEIDDFERTI